MCKILNLVYCKSAKLLPCPCFKNIYNPSIIFHHSFIVNDFEIFLRNEKHSINVLCYYHYYYYYYYYYYYCYYYYYYYYYYFHHHFITVKWGGTSILIIALFNVRWPYFSGVSWFSQLFQKHIDVMRLLSDIFREETENIVNCGRTMFVNVNTT